MTSAAPTDQAHQNFQAEQALNAHSDAELGLRTVSYTHLTLPTTF